MNLHVLSVPGCAHAGSGWSPHVYKWLFGTLGGTRSSVDSSQKCLGSRSKAISKLCQEINTSCHLHVLLDGELPMTVRAVHAPGQNLPSLNTWECFCKPATRREKKMRRKTGLCQETLAAMTQRYMGGRSVDSEESVS